MLARSILFIAICTGTSPVRAQSSFVDRVLKAEEETHVEEIEYNRKEHLACVIDRAKARATISHASDDAIVAYAFIQCRTFEERFKQLLLSGPNTISGGRLAVPIGTALKIVDIRKKSLREEILATIANVR